MIDDVTFLKLKVVLGKFRAQILSHMLWMS